MIYDIRNLKFAYEKDSPVLNGVDLTVSEGEILTVLGRNGAGKSTLFACMMGLHKDIEGEVLLEGKNVLDLNEKTIASIVSFVPQAHAASFGFTVFEYILMGCASGIGLFGKPGKPEIEAAYAALDEMDLFAFADRNFEELSGGEKQQVCIARAIASKPMLILFDEPTAHLDYSNQIKVLRIIKSLSEKGYSVMITSHDPNHALLLGGRVALLDGNGRIEAGNVDEIVCEEKLRSIYGADLKIRYIEEFGRQICIYPSI